MEDVKVIDSFGHTIYISEQEYRRIKTNCSKCKEGAWSKRYLGIELDFVNCPYDCENDIYNYRLYHQDKVVYE